MYHVNFLLKAVVGPLGNGYCGHCSQHLGVNMHEIAYQFVFVNKIIPADSHRSSLYYIVLDVNNEWEDKSSEKEKFFGVNEIKEKSIGN